MVQVLSGAKEAFIWLEEHLPREMFLFPYCCRIEEAGQAWGCRGWVLNIEHVQSRKELVKEPHQMIDDADDTQSKIIYRVLEAVTR